MHSFGTAGESNQLKTIEKKLVEKDPQVADFAGLRRLGALKKESPIRSAAARPGGQISGEVGFPGRAAVLFAVDYFATGTPACTGHNHPYVSGFVP